METNEWLLKRAIQYIKSKQLEGCEHDSKEVVDTDDQGEAQAMRIYQGYNCM